MGLPWVAIIHLGKRAEPQTNQPMLRRPADIQAQALLDSARFVVPRSRRAHQFSGVVCRTSIIRERGD